MEKISNRQSLRRRLPTTPPRTTSTMVHWPFGNDMDEEPSNGSGSSQDRSYSTSVAEAVPRPFLPGKSLGRTVGSSALIWRNGCSRLHERKPMRRNCKTSSFAKPVALAVGYASLVWWGVVRH
jgi:hypothetical protein